VTSDADALIAAVKTAGVKRLLVAPGERTGHFRLGGDQLLRDAQGKSHISMEDFAIAMVDEVEQPAHSRQRFTVGY
jgi:putative NADH-flavin reductase